MRQDNNVNEIDPVLHKLATEKLQYWEKYFDAILVHFKTDSILNKFVTNRDVTGAFGEALVKSFIKSMLPQFRISTGTIVSLRDHIYLEEQNIKYDRIPQADLIIWDPSILPAVVEIDDFALVPNLAARGIIEVKRTTKYIEKLREQLKEWKRYINMVPLYHREDIFMDCAPNILGIVIKHGKPLLNEEISPEMWDRRRKTPVVIRLFDNNYSKDIDGFVTLIFFLTHIAKQTDKVLLNKLKQLESDLKKLEKRR